VPSSSKPISTLLFKERRRLETYALNAILARWVFDACTSQKQQRGPNVQQGQCHLTWCWQLHCRAGSFSQHVL
jgi:hypothetical protein